MKWKFSFSKSNYGHLLNLKEHMLSLVTCWLCDDRTETELLAITMQCVALTTWAVLALVAVVTVTRELHYWHLNCGMVRHRLSRPASPVTLHRSLSRLWVISYSSFPGKLDLRYNYVKHRDCTVSYLCQDIDIVIALELMDVTRTAVIWVGAIWSVLLLLVADF